MEAALIIQVVAIFVLLPLPAPPLPTSAPCFGPEFWVLNLPTRWIDCNYFFPAPDEPCYQDCD